MKKPLLITSFVISLFCSSLLWVENIYAGELSNFELLGFNDTTSYLAFAEYGMHNNVQPYASIYIVNIAHNTFASDGIIQQMFPQTSAIDESGTGALYSLLLAHGSTLNKYSIDPLNKGRLIYILLDGDDPGDEFTFTDYKTKFVYSVRLQQTIRGVGQTAKGAFTIAVDILHNNTTSNRTVGNASYYRDAVALYKIRTIYSSKDNTSVVFVIEKLSFDEQGETIIRYMVETLTWR